jgi:hypothetical protein
MIREWKNMEHMSVPWRTYKFGDARWRVVTDTEDPIPLLVCDIATYLPGDKTGAKTARAMVKEHNKKFKK